MTSVVYSDACLSDQSDGFTPLPIGDNSSFLRRLFSVILTPLFTRFFHHGDSQFDVTDAFLHINLSFLLCRVNYRWLILSGWSAISSRGCL